MRPAVIELRDGVYWVGVKDWGRRLFDGLIPLPHGTSYNAYLVKGDDRTALVDTVNPGFEGELLAKIDEVADPDALDYVVMNHAEPDHAGSSRLCLRPAPGPNSSSPRRARTWLPATSGSPASGCGW